MMRGTWSGTSRLRKPSSILARWRCCWRISSLRLTGTRWVFRVVRRRTRITSSSIGLRVRWWIGRSRLCRGRRRRITTSMTVRVSRWTGRGICGLCVLRTAEQEPDRADHVGPCGVDDFPSGRNIFRELGVGAIFDRDFAWCRTNRRQRHISVFHPARVADTSS